MIDRPGREISGATHFTVASTITMGDLALRVFESAPRLEEPPRRRLRLTQLSDSNLYGKSRFNWPNYPQSIDVRRALAKLPKRWPLAIQLVYFQGYSRTETAQNHGVQSGADLQAASESQESAACIACRISKRRGYVQVAKAKRHGRTKRAVSESRSRSPKRHARTNRARVVPDASPSRRAIRVMVPLHAVRI